MTKELIELCFPILIEDTDEDDEDDEEECPRSSALQLLDTISIKLPNTEVLPVILGLLKLQPKVTSTVKEPPYQPSLLSAKDVPLPSSKVVTCLLLSNLPVQHFKPTVQHSEALLFMPLANLLNKWLELSLNSLQKY